MRIMTILGTRPEIIRLSRVIDKLDGLADSHVVVHTGQNYDPGLSDVFFDELRVRPPDRYLGARGETFGEQLSQIIAHAERAMIELAPHRVLILGDTNSALAAIVAKRRGIPVYHLEAGNRCHDDRVPEEINRRIVDHSSDVLMPYTDRSRMNLLREGIEGQRIFVVGNPIHEVLRHHHPQIQASDAHGRLGVEPEKFFLATLHREENVEIEARLRSVVSAFAVLHRRYGFPVICSLHPRTRKRMQAFGIAADQAGVRFVPPLGFFDFVALERSAFCVLSDSGTVQEECAILRVANVTVRDVTERPETLECGSNVLSGADTDSIVRCVAAARQSRRSWTVPTEYLLENVSDTVCKILLGFHGGARLEPPPPMTARHPPA